MDYKDQGNWKSNFTPLIKFLIIILAFTLLATTITGAVILSKNNCQCKLNGDDITNSTTTGPDNIDVGNTLHLVSRGEWLAMPPTEPLDNLLLPVDRVIIAHTATENCSSHASCVYRSRIIQDFHMKSRGFNDIGYSFLVGGDGNVYEGRGWDMQGAHTKGYNMNSICIAFIGTFSKLEPPEKQVNAAKVLIDEGIRLKKIVPNYRLYGSRQLIGSEGPGDALYAIIKSWPNWSQSI